MALVLVAGAGCLEPKSHICETGTQFERTCPEHAECDDMHHLCIDPDQRTACVDHDEAADCSYGAAVTIAGLCHDGVCFEKRCGDGIISSDTDEVCEGTDLGGATDCESIGYYERSPLSCTNTCAYDTSKCLGFCGDGIVTVGHEACDGAPPPDTCTTFGYGAGFLDCKFCAPDLDGCKFFGWHGTDYVTPLLFDIDGTTDDNMYAVGPQATLLHFDRDQWVKVDLSSCVGSTMTALHAIQVVGPGEMWIGGQEGSMAIVLHVNGATCTKTMPGPTGSVGRISVTGPSDVWATLGGGIYRFNGTSWTSWDTGTYYYDVWASGPNDAYRVTTTSGTAKLEHWTGAAWSPITLPTNLEIDSVYGTSPTDVYGGGYRTNTGKMWVFHYNGGTWTDISPPAFDGYVNTFSSANGYIFTGTNTSQVYAYDGKMWTDLNTQVANDVAQIAATPSGTVYMVNSGIGQVHRFGGSTIISRTPFATQTTRPFARATNEIYAINPINNRVQWFNGDIWQEDTGIVSPDAAYDVWASPTGVLYAVGTFGLSKRTSPNNWSNLSTTAGGVMWGLADNDIWIAGGGFHHWNGATMSSCASCTESDAMFDMWGAAPNDIFAVGDNSHIMHYNGTGWSDQASGVTGNVALFAVWGWSGSDVVAIGDRTVIHYDGTSWQDLKSPIPDVWRDVWGASLSDLFIVSDQGHMWHYDGAHWSPVAIGNTPFIKSMTGIGTHVYWFPDFKEMELLRIAPWN